MNADRRYTDTDVRSSEELWEAAIEYARDYKGDFEFLVAAQELVIATQSLPVAVARGVLNCMRADPRSALFARPIPYPKPPPRSRLRAVPEPPIDIRPWIIKTPTRTTHPFGVATSLLPSGRAVLHRVGKLVTEWRLRDHPDDNRYAEVKLHWVCSTYPKRYIKLYKTPGDAIREGVVNGCRSGCWAIIRGQETILAKDDSKEMWDGREA